MKSILVVVVMVAGLCLSAQVKIVNSPLPLDGKLTENGWQDVPEQTGFSPIKAIGKAKADARTAFKVVADRDNLYMSILCHEDRMEKLRKSSDLSSLWASDAVEVFFSPTGHPDEYYQFVISAGNVRYSMFYGEAGMIRPDPYRPDWESKVFYGKDYWLIQLRIPFRSFYMTRNAKWSSDWLLNIARTRTPVRELSSWSPLQSKFLESRNFRQFKGFPRRNPAQDIYIQKAKPSIRNFSGGVYSGPLELTIEASSAATGKYELSVEEPDGKSSVHPVTLKEGINRIILPETEYLRKAQGKTNLTLSLKSLKTGTVFSRSYPVDIEYKPVRIVLQSPGYKRCFFPGQDFSKIAGELHLRLSDAQKKSASVEVTLSGDGLTKKTLKLKADRGTIPFTFDSKGLVEGGKAALSVKLTDDGKEMASASQTITRLKKSNGSMVWIENGILYKNGKPWYPRDIYARGYRGGTAFGERFRADDFADTKFKAKTVEPRRLIRGIEAKEATKDIKPCPELFEKIRQVVESVRNDPDFNFYYISDEPECRSVSPVYLKYIYDFISELDPYRPLVTCSRAADLYLDCADIFSVHPYISPIISNGKRILDKPIHQVRNYLQDVTKFKRMDKIVGFTGQFFSYKFNNQLADYPTWEELESMSWSAIVQGSRFHYPYAYHDLGDRPQIYEGFRYFNQSIKAVEGLLLSNRKQPVKAVDPENRIDTLLVEDGNATLLIVVNLKNGPLETVVSAEHLKQYSSMFEFRGDGSRKLVNGELELSLKPYECVVLTSKKLDAGLKTRNQVLKEITALEKARTSRGNLLFEKGATFEVDSSNPGNTLGVKNKLFDGTLDMYAWGSKKWRKEHWVELNFRKKPPKFSKIGIYGHHVDQPTVKIWKFGEWKTTIPKKIDKTKYSTVLDFGEELKSVKIRICFAVKTNQDQVELYEIELLK